MCKLGCKFSMQMNLKHITFLKSSSHQEKNREPDKLQNAFGENAVVDDVSL